MGDGVRADARRNRDRLLAVAADAFTTDGPVSLEAIAKAAGVGIGTLYRHFPNREALIEAVYRTELAEVSASTGPLLAAHPPAVALRRWMDRYAQFVAAKRGMAESLKTVLEYGAVAPPATRDAIVGAVRELLEAGAADGTLRADVTADDVVAALLGIFLAGGAADQTGRLLDLLVDGLVARRG